MVYLRSLFYGIALGTVVAALLGYLVKARDFQFTVTLLVAAFIITGITFILGRFKD
jgi:low affinity Fe/Cu permease